MKAFPFVSALLVVCCMTTSGQITFQKTYGGTNVDYGFSVKQTTDGGYILIGSTESFGSGSSDVYLIKTNNAGDTLWTKTIGGIDYESGESVQQTRDGGYIISGNAPDPVYGSDVYLIKTDSTGNVLWRKNFEGGDGNSVFQNNDNGYIICGIVAIGLSTRDVSLIRTDSLGNAQWIKFFNIGGGFTEGYSVQQTDDNGFVVAGTLGPSGYYAYLIKTNATGDVTWHKVYNSGTTDYECYGMKKTNDGGYVLVGSNYTSPGSGTLLIKTDNFGNVLWSKKYDFSGVYVVGNSVQQTIDNGYIISGSIYDWAASKTIPFLLKTDSAGNSSWSKKYLGSLSFGSTTFPAVEQTRDTGYILCRSTDSLGSGSVDFYLVKTDGNGTSGCNDSSLTVTSSLISTTLISFPLYTSTGSSVTTPSITVSSGGIVTTLCYNSLTGINEAVKELNLNLLHVSPNPISISANISFSLSQSQHVSLKVFDVSGRLVSIVADKIFEAGKNQLTWKAEVVNAGIYFLRLETENYSEVTKVSLMKE